MQYITNSPEETEQIAAKLAVADCDLSIEITEKAKELMEFGLKQKDASHIACAIHLGAESFLTTDNKILNKQQITEIKCLNPIDFVRRYCNAN